VENFFYTPEGKKDQKKGHFFCCCDQKVTKFFSKKNSKKLKTFFLVFFSLFEGRWGIKKKYSLTLYFFKFYDPCQGNLVIK